MPPVKPDVMVGAAAKRTAARSPSSGDRGKPISSLFARVENTHPGIAEQVGLSSAALRAGELVRSMRKARGWTQTELADMLGWDQVRISNIERGEGTRGPTFDVLHKIAIACAYDLQFTPREMAVPAETPAPVRKRIFTDNPLYAGIVKRAVNKIGRWTSPAAEPDLAYACTAFISGIDENAAVHAEIVEGSIEPAADVSKPKIKLDMPGVPYIEVTGHGQRMVMVPVSVEPAAARENVSTEVELKFYPNRLPDVP